MQDHVCTIWLRLSNLLIYTLSIANSARHSAGLLSRRRSSLGSAIRESNLDQEIEDTCIIVHERLCGGPNILPNQRQTRCIS